MRISSTIARRSQNALHLLFCPGLGSPKSDVQPIQDWVRRQQGDVIFQQIPYNGSRGEHVWDVNDWSSDILSALKNNLVPKIMVCNSASAQAFLRALVSTPSSFGSVRGVVLTSPGVGMQLENYIKRVLPGVASKLYQGEKVDHPSSDANRKIYVNLRCLDEYARGCVLNSNSQFPEIPFPIRIVHGLHDKLVPYSKAFDLLERLPCEDKEIYLLQSGHIITDFCKNKMVEVALDSLWNSMQQNLLETEEEEEEEQGSRSVTTAGLQAYAA